MSENVLFCGFKPVFRIESAFSGECIVKIPIMNKRARLPTLKHS